jgi:hypothetical protein
MSVVTTSPAADAATSRRVGKDLTFMGRRAPGNARILSNAEFAPLLPLLGFVQGLAVFRWWVRTRQSCNELPA